jgi:hypothetical protein
MRTARFVGALCFSRGKQRFSVAVQEVQAVAARQKQRLLLRIGLPIIQDYHQP